MSGETMLLATLALVLWAGGVVALGSLLQLVARWLRP